MGYTRLLLREILFISQNNNDNNNNNNKKKKKKNIIPLIRNIYVFHFFRIPQMPSLVKLLLVLMQVTVLGFNRKFTTKLICFMSINNYAPYA